MRESELVATTDKSNKLFYGNLDQGVEVSDVRQMMNSDIDLMNKSKRRSLVRNTNGLRLRSEEQSRIKNAKIELLINFLAGKDRTLKEIYKHIFPNDKTEVKKNKTWLTNFLNQVKNASESIIHSKEKERGVWRIDPNYRSGLKALIEKTQKDKSKIWKKYDSKEWKNHNKTEIKRKEKRGVIPIPAMSASPAPKKTSIEKKSIVVSGDKPVKLSIIVGKVSIEIKIGC